ncbi:hypothetical protein D1814_10320 [Alteromonas sp. BL110]|uniref:hypothetical protein n=1 Tax=Alteromonas sp. BL110 TaxID=1714845 RepID=UPI000E4BED19|nr:hypothetical protein [Alteromonas sp. BL110]AXT39044.1 hypothetical protein D1814_10320 [Alteromonas sp. BL110]RKM85300.1 hypothetical protein D7031_00770 [Alteromonas sp. BL110]
MKTLLAAFFIFFASSSFAGVVTYDFTRIVLGDEADETSLIGQISFDENETQFNMNTWLSFFFQLEFDGTIYNILEDDIADFAIVDLDDEVFGDENGEGFQFFIEDASVPYEFAISTGLAGLGETDTCVFFESGDRCAGSLFQLVKTVEANDGSNNGSTQVSEPASFATAMLVLFAFTSLRKRRH